MISQSTSMIVLILTLLYSKIDNRIILAFFKKHYIFYKSITHFLYFGGQTHLLVYNLIIYFWYQNYLLKYYSKILNNIYYIDLQLYFKAKISEIKFMDIKELMIL